MTPLLLTPPAVEPLTLAEAKAWLRLDGDDEDAIVLGLITAARALVERAARRLLISQSWRVVADGWPADGCLRLPLAPVTEIAAVRVLDREGVATLVPPAAYRLEALRDPPLLVVTGTVPLPGRALSGVEIDCIAGFGASADAVPETLRHAVRLLVGRWFEHRGDAAGDELALPADIAALIAPYRRPRL